MLAVSFSPPGRDGEERQPHRNDTPRCGLWDRRAYPRSHVEITRAAPNRVVVGDEIRRERKGSSFERDDGIGGRIILVGEEHPGDAGISAGNKGWFRIEVDI